MLVYYDGPQLFTAADHDGHEYVCLSYDITEDGNFLAIGCQVFSNEKNSFLNSETDLTSLIITAESNERIFDVTVCGNVVTAGRRLEFVEENMLPVGKYYYKR